MSKPPSFLNNGYKLAPQTIFTHDIKIFGVGGAGCNAVAHMYRSKITNVDFVLANTDRQSLDAMDFGYKIRLGNQSVDTKGNGTGMKADMGRLAAEENEAEIRKVLTDNTEMLFITAGMGGGTGTGAAPVIARIGKELGILIVAIVTAPFEDEGSVKIEQANKGIAELKNFCDTVLVISNEKLYDLYPDMPVGKAFAQADEILANATRCISEIVTKTGIVNSDMNDVKTILKDAGHAVIGLAEAKGENRALEGIEAALTSPLLDDRSIKGAKHILITVAANSKNQMRMNEKRIITNFVLERVEIGHDLLKFSPINDDTLEEDTMRVTIIAAGFNGRRITSQTKPNVPNVTDIQQFETTYWPQRTISWVEKIGEMRHKRQSSGWLKEIAMPAYQREGLSVVPMDEIYKNLGENLDRFHLTL